MPTYIETILPSGRAIRIKPLFVRDKLNIDRRVQLKMGTMTDVMFETVCTCLLAYTKEPVEIVSKRIEKDGKTEDVPDADLTFEAIEKNKLWIGTNYETLTVEGPGSVVEAFKLQADFAALQREIDKASFGDAQLSPLAGKARTVSVER
jgi:hypothetical protein